MRNFKKGLMITVLWMLQLLPIVGHAAELSNLSILIPSCDKYAEAWDPFFHTLFKYWPGLNQNIYLIAGHKKFEDPRVKMVSMGDEKSWSDNMLFAIDQIKEDYVMIILEDYFLVKPVNELRLKSLFAQMKKENAAYLSLVNISSSEKVIHKSMPGVGYLKKEADYRTALQIVIWNKAVLKSLLVSGENPWHFEEQGTERSRSIKKPFMVVVNDQPIEYFGAIDRGQWNEKGIAFLKNEKLQVKKDLPVNNAFRRWIKGPVRDYTATYLVRPMRRMLAQMQSEGSSK